MLVDKENYRVIGRQLRCHDSVIEHFEYNFDRHLLIVSFSRSLSANIKTVSFEDVLMYMVTGFDPWGHDNYVFDWQFLELKQAEPYFGVILHEANDPSNVVDYDIDSVVFSEIVFASGDRIRIACQKMHVDFY